MYKHAPSSSQEWATSLTMPLGKILKAVSEEFLRAHFSGGVRFANESVPGSSSEIVVTPHVERFQYRYNSLRNAGFAITPQVEVDLQVRISDETGLELLEQERILADIAYARGGRRASARREMPPRHA